MATARFLQYERTSTKVLLSALLTAAVLCGFLWVPEWMANQYRFTNVKDWAAQVSANRSLLVNLVGGIAVVATIYFTYGNLRIAQRNFKIAQRNFRIAQQSLKATEDRSVTDLFCKGVEQLGNSDASVRLGGIYSLARIAKRSRDDYLSTMQTLTGFLRVRHGAQSRRQAASEKIADGFASCPVEVQAILTIIGERFWEYSHDYCLDLSYLEISDAWVPRANYSNTYFWFVTLTNWNLEGANLRDADFKGSVLISCELTGADLTNANLEGVVIRNPIGLTKAQLDKANNVDSALYQAVDV